MEETSQKTSKFSSGLNIVMRLDELWKITHKDAREGKYNDWNTTLDRIWLELARDFKDEDGDEVDDFKEKKEKFKKFDDKIKEIGNFKDSVTKGFGSISSEDIKKRNEHYKILMEKQLFLARLENELGKGTTFDEGEDDDFD